MINRCIKGIYEKPYSDLHLESSIQIVVMTPKGQRPNVPERCPPLVLKLLHDMWDLDSTKRPNCEELITRLEQLQKDLAENPQSYPESELRRPSVEFPELIR